MTKALKQWILICLGIAALEIGVNYFMGVWLRHADTPMQIFSFGVAFAGLSNSLWRYRFPGFSSARSYELYIRANPKEKDKSKYIFVHAPDLDTIRQVRILCYIGLSTPIVVSLVSFALNRRWDMVRNMGLLYLVILTALVLFVEVANRNEAKRLRQPVASTNI